IPEMRIMLPDYDLPRSVWTAHVGDEALQCLRHVAIPQVPGRNAVLEHRAIVLLSVLHEAGILLRVKIFVFSHASVAAGILGGTTPQFEQLRDHLVLTGFGYPKARGIAIRLGIFAVVIKTRVAITGTSCGFGLHLVEVPK